MRCLHKPGLAGWEVLGAVALIVLTIDNLLGWYTIIPKEGWREAVAYVTSHAKPGDVLIAYPNYVRLPVDYYMQRQERRLHDCQAALPVARMG